ncbi:hypothetical protein [Nocardioides panacisoli]|uniref:Uncharacterized protein n=1 Tax=Nocardioides panacisoli TaxID=627624 RepID=A0ABP7IS42_9ACTN
MCYPRPCKQCGKTTWDGCGQHVEAVRMMVPTADWCPGHPGAGRRGLLGRLLGK